MLLSAGSHAKRRAMTVSERRKYFKVMKARYVGAKGGEQGLLLSEMQKVTGLPQGRHSECCITMCNEKALNSV